MDLMQILQGHLSDDVLAQMGQQVGADKEQTATAANGILGSLLGGLAKNAQSPEGLQGLMAALDRDHDGSILDDIMDLVKSGGQMAPHAAPAATNGVGILGHILGGQQEQVAQQVSQSSGLQIGQIMKLMPILAPILMGVLGKTKNTNGLGIGDLAGVLMGSAQNATQMPGMGGLLGNILGSVLSGGQPQQQQPQQGMGGLMGNILGNILGGGR